MLLLGLQVVGVLEYVSSIVNLWLSLVSFIATDMALVALFPTVWWVSPDTLGVVCGKCESYHTFGFGRVSLVQKGTSPTSTHETNKMFSFS